MIGLWTAIEKAGLGMTHLRAACVLIDHGQHLQDGSILIPSVKGLAEVSGLSRHKLNGDLCALVEAGIFDREGNRFLQRFATGAKTITHPTEHPFVPSQGTQCTPTRYTLYPHEVHSVPPRGTSPQNGAESEGCQNVVYPLEVHSVPSGGTHDPEPTPTEHPFCGGGDDLLRDLKILTLNNPSSLRDTLPREAESEDGLRMEDGGVKKITHLGEVKLPEGLSPAVTSDLSIMDCPEPPPMTPTEAAVARLRQEAGPLCRGDVEWVDRLLRRGEMQRVARFAWYEWPQVRESMARNSANITSPAGYALAAYRKWEPLPTHVWPPDTELPPLPASRRERYGANPEAPGGDADRTPTPAPVATGPRKPKPLAASDPRVTAALEALPNAERHRREGEIQAELFRSTPSASTWGAKTRERTIEQTLRRQLANEIQGITPEPATTDLADVAAEVQAAMEKRKITRKPTPKPTAAPAPEPAAPPKPTYAEPGYNPREDPQVMEAWERLGLAERDARKERAYQELRREKLIPASAPPALARVPSISRALQTLAQEIHRGARTEALRGRQGANGEDRDAIPF